MENRGGLSGTAELMYALKWDNQLEYVATCWNKQCQFDHDKCRSTEEFPKVGQNLYWSSGQACDWKRDLDAALQGWYDEVKDMSDQCLHQFGVGCDTMKVGHFTQLAWGSTARVGCSLVEYDGQCQIACNYGPSGNFQGQPMYVRGPATCEFDSVKYKNLCLLRADDESGAKRIKGIYKNLYLIIYLIIVIGIYY
nr:venom allergen 5-like [Onthophagus taurus]